MTARTQLSPLRFRELPSQPTTPSAGEQILYARAGRIYQLGSDGQEVDLGSAEPTVAVRRLTANATNSTTTLSSLTDLGLTVLAGEVWTFRVAVYFSSAVATTGIALAMGGTATATSVRYGAQIPTGATTMFSGTAAALGTKVIGTGSAVAVVIPAVMDGIVQVNAGGTLVPQFCSEVSASLVTVASNSHVVYARM